MSDPSVRAELLNRSWFRRTVRLTGDVTATVEYDGAGAGQVVRVDGVTVVHDRSEPMPARRLEFPLGAVAAVIEVRWLLFPPMFTAFRLMVDDQVVYSDGFASSIGNLPLPSSPPAPTAEGLPIPGQAEDEGR